MGPRGANRPDASVEVQAEALGSTAHRISPAGADRHSVGCTMLFFFELFLFVLLMLTLALGEFVSRWLSLVLWLVVTGFSLIGYVLARLSLSGVSGDGVPATGGSSPVTSLEPTDEKWARTLLYNWRRSNALLVLGAVVVGCWYWFST